MIFPLIFYGLLTSLALSSGAHYILIFKEKTQAQQNLNQLAYGLTWARAYAIHHQQSVTICPSQDLIHCQPTHWQGGFIIFSNQTLLKACPLTGQGYLQLFCFGQTKYQLKIEANGTTYQNGHFEYLLKHHPPMRLVFNRYLRFR